MTLVPAQFLKSQGGHCLEVAPVISINVHQTSHLRVSWSYVPSALGDSDQTPTLSLQWGSSSCHKHDAANLFDIHNQAPLRGPALSRSSTVTHLPTDTRKGLSEQTSGKYKTHMQLVFKIISSLPEEKQMKGNQKKSCIIFNSYMFIFILIHFI